MPTSPRTIRLGGEYLRDQRHVCALISGDDDFYVSLLPFIVDGIQHGDRAFHMVDPDTRDAHLARLSAAGIDVAAATRSGQLEVRTWDESYLRGGRFDRSAVTAYVRERLADGRSLGYPLTRLIGSMDWATDEALVEDVIIHETRLDDLLRTMPDFVICAYDLNLHSARLVADELGVHAYALVGGVLRTNRSPAGASARDRLLVAGSRLFHERGIVGTGVDAIIDLAGVAKATFYRHFPSKDDLIVAWLRDPRTRWFDRVRGQAQASGPEPSDEILVFFEAVAEWLETDGFRGCPYLNTAVEIADEGHPARRIVREYLDEIEDYFRAVLTTGGYRDAQLLASELHSLLAGAIALAVARRTGAHALAAREAAQALLAASPLRPVDA